MSDWSDDYSNTDLSGSQAGTQGGGGFDFDTFMASIYGTMTPEQQAAATSLGAQDTGALSGWVSGETLPAGKSMTQQAKEGSSLSKWWGSLNTDDKKIGLSILTMLGGGLAQVGKGKREDRMLQIQQQNADANTAGVNLRREMFDRQMANANSIASTNFGTATQPGLINAPVTLTRNRLKPTPGAPQ